MKARLLFNAGGVGLLYLQRFPLLCSTTKNNEISSEIDFIIAANVPHNSRKCCIYRTHLTSLRRQAL